MSEKPVFGQRIAEGAKMEQLEDYGSALRTIRAARAVFLLTLILSLLLNIGAYSAARWGGVLRPLSELQDRISAPADTASDGTAPAAETARTFSFWYYLIELMMPLAEFLGQVSCALLAICFLFAANVCLAGGLGGVRGSISAFFWTLVVLALLFPWARWLGGTADVVQVPGAYATFNELCNVPASFANRTREVLHYARFLGYPALALLVLLVGNARYARAHRMVRQQLEARMIGRA